MSFADADGAVAGDGVLRLDALGLGPLDVVAMVDETGAPRPELTELLEDAAASQRPGGAPADAATQVRFERGDGWDDDERSLTEALEVARAIGALVHGARPLAPADLAPAGETGSVTVDVVELRRRADNVVAAGTRAREQLSRAASNDVERARPSLRHRRSRRRRGTRSSPRRRRRARSGASRRRRRRAR